MIIRPAAILNCSLNPSSNSPTKSTSTSRIPNSPLHPIPSAAGTTADAGLRFREKLVYIESLKVSPGKALQMNPGIRSTPLSTLVSVEKCLTSMGLQRSALGRIFDMLPQLLTSDPYTDLYPFLDFLLNDVQIPFHDVPKSIVRCPRLLVCSVEGQLRPALRFLQELGFTGPNRLTSRTTLLLVSNVEETLIPKLYYLVGLGFEFEEVVGMVLRSPGLLTFSVANNYKPKVEYFLKEMGGDLAELKMFPQFFSFSLEGKIKPRHMILAENGFSLPLHEMLKVSDGEFNALLVEMRLKLIEQRNVSEERSSKGKPSQ